MTELFEYDTDNDTNPDDNDTNPDDNHWFIRESKMIEFMKIRATQDKDKICPWYMPMVYAVFFYCCQCRMDRYI